MDRKNITKHFSSEIRNALEKIPDSEFTRIQEIRLRCNRPLSVFSGDLSFTVAPDGTLSQNSQRKTVTQNEIKYTFESVCQYSVHSFKNEIRNGFLTVTGGHRAGICGTASADFEKIDNIKNINGINFRIAREVKNCADEIIKKLFSDKKIRNSVLIAGGVGSGKTTVLRDLARQIGDKIKVCIIDTRGEIAAVCDGQAGCDVGMFTDVLDSYPKAAGIETAVRVMSPDIIICDEIGSQSEMEAVLYASNCGVKVIASIHCGEIFTRSDLPPGIFDHIVTLRGAGFPSQVKNISDGDSLK
ncbi:MAG: Flp pilus assembly complex ATPase component TadA [Ruminococcus sp.]|jgi:stage III sporulation protein AA|nr:Flp pilus assembly complex ATPase component TadA [Ruminococcus sp.]